MEFKQYRRQRRLAHVARWGVIPTTRVQSVAEHSYNVASISRVLLDFHNMGAQPYFIMSVLEYAMDHDDDEAISGDPPSTRNGLPKSEDIRTMNQSKILVKCADYIESLVFSYEEEAMGNRLINPHVSSDAMSRLRVYWEHLDTSPVDINLDSFVARFLEHTVNSKIMHPRQEK